MNDNKVLLFGNRKVNSAWLSDSEERSRKGKECALVSWHCLMFIHTMQDLADKKWKYWPHAAAGRTKSLTTRQDFPAKNENIDLKRQQAGCAFSWHCVMKLSPQLAICSIPPTHSHQPLHNSHSNLFLILVHNHVMFSSVLCYMFKHLHPDPKTQ